MSGDPRFETGAGKHDQREHELGLDVLRTTVGEAVAREALATWWDKLSDEERVSDRLAAKAVEVVRESAGTKPVDDDAFARGVHLLLAELLADVLVAHPTATHLRAVNAIAHRLRWTAFNVLCARVLKNCEASGAARVAAVIEGELTALLGRISHPSLEPLPLDPLDAFRNSHHLETPHIEELWPLQILARLDSCRFCEVVDSAPSLTLRRAAFDAAQLERDIDLLAAVMQLAPPTFGEDGVPTGRVSTVLAVEAAAGFAATLLRAIDSSRHDFGVNTDDVAKAIEQAANKEVPERLSMLWRLFLCRSDGLPILSALFIECIRRTCVRPPTSSGYDDLAIVARTLGEALTTAGVTPSTLLDARGGNPADLTAVGETFVASMFLDVPPEIMDSDRGAIVQAADSLLVARNPHLTALTRSRQQAWLIAERLACVVMTHATAFDDWHSILGRLAQQRRREEFGRSVDDETAGASNELWLRVGLYLCAHRSTEPARNGVFREVVRSAFRAHLLASGDFSKSARQVFLESFAFVPEVFPDAAERVEMLRESFGLVGADWAAQIGACGLLLQNGIAISQLAEVTSAVGFPLASSIKIAQTMATLDGHDHRLPQSYRNVVRALAQQSV